jgi:NAD(P)-dependent dehydrogenase (short-subunit alcohol dehydrogenase family)
MQVKGASAIVTGGASGLGAATAKALADAGAVVTVFDLKKEQAESMAKELGPEHRFVAGDVSKVEDVEQAVATAKEAGPVRICVNCAGIGWAERLVDKSGKPHDLGRFEFVLRVNLIGTFNVMRLAAAAMASTEPMEDGERGVIVNTASVAAFEGQVGQIAYSASKGGIVGMTVPAARDLAPAGIRVVTIAPGIMNTPLFALLPEPQREALGQTVLFPKRMGKPEEFASLVLEIARNSYINGEVIRLDGGIRMQPK